jgi:hypothetical protein
MIFFERNISWTTQIRLHQVRANSADKAKEGTSFPPNLGSLTFIEPELAIKSIATSLLSEDGPSQTQVFFGAGVDVPHLTHLVPLLRQIFLVDTNSIDPKS